MPEGKYFFIRSQFSGKVLDIFEAVCQPDQSVLVYGAKDSDNDNQLWFSHPLTKTIRSKQDKEYCLDIDGDDKLVVNPYSDKDSQRWKISGDRIQRYSDPEKVLDIEGENDDDGATVIQYAFHGGENQLWEFDCKEPDYFFIRSKMHDKVMDITGNNPEEGTCVCMYGQKESPEDNQLWYEDRYGYIRSKLNDMVLDASGEQMSMHSHDTGSDRQRWVFDGELIRNVDRPEEVLDIKGRDEDNGAALIPWRQHGNDNQCWSQDFI